jgi:hypothetical protein
VTKSCLPDTLGSVSADKFNNVEVSGCTELEGDNKDTDHHDSYIKCYCDGDKCNSAVTARAGTAALWLSASLALVASMNFLAL